MAAIDIVSQPATLSFSSSVDDIVVQTSRTSVDVVLTIRGDNVFEETLYPDLSGRIVLSDLSPLVEPYVREYQRVVMQCQFSSEGYSVSIAPVTILYTKADVGMSATDFTQNHFLTLLEGEKITALNREERLYAFDNPVAIVNAEVRLPVGTYTNLTAQLSAVTFDSNGIAQFDVSPRKIIDAIGLVGGRLLQYTVTSGNRKQVFRCIEEQILPEPSLLFLNSFGCEEFLHCNGTLKRSTKFDRSSGRAKSKLQNYSIIEERQFTANTGWLNDDMADWATDLLRSDEVYLWENGRRGKEIVITDSKDEINNEDDYMTAYELTYTYAQRVNNVMRRRRAARIFSDTFEDIYN